jgi:hypothetical protein
LLVPAVAGCAALLLAGCGGKQQASSGAQVSSSNPASQATSGTAGCSLPAGDQQIPRTPPQGTSWVLVNMVAVPGTEAYGPQLTDGGLRRCFAHSPGGAVFAAYNFIAAMSLPDDPDGAKTFPILRRVMTPGANLESYIKWLPTQPDTSGGGGGVQMVGFRVLDATADRVTLLVAGQAGGGYASSTWTMVWQDGDWKVVSPQPGEMAGAPYTSLSDLSGFVPWRGA